MCGCPCIPETAIKISLPKSKDCIGKLVCSGRVEVQRFTPGMNVGAERVSMSYCTSQHKASEPMMQIASGRRCCKMCSNETKSKRSALCCSCFKEKAATSGARSAGNRVTGVAKQACGALGAGNRVTGIAKRTSGALGAGKKVMGLAKRTSGALSTGNRVTGLAKRTSGSLGAGNKVTGIAKRTSGALGAGNRVTGLARRKSGSLGAVNKVAELAKQRADVTLLTAGSSMTEFVERRADGAGSAVSLISDIEELSCVIAAS